MTTMKVYPHSKFICSPCSAVSCFVDVTPILASFSLFFEFEDADDNDDDLDDDPIIEFKTVKHNGAVNRIRVRRPFFASRRPPSLSLRRSLPALFRCCLVFCVSSSSSSSLVSAQQARDRGDLVRHGSGAHLEPPHPHPLARRAAHPAARAHQPRVHLQGPQDRGTPAPTMLLFSFNL